MELTSGQTKEWVRNTPTGKPMACRLCADCGTRLFHQLLGQDELVSIKPGTLTGAQNLNPVGHIWTKSKQSWVNIPAGVLQYEENPPGFDAFV
jgi:hypothetical protein